MASFLYHRISFRDRYTRVIAIPILCAVVGSLIGAKILFSSTSKEVEYPLPHHVPKYPGNLTLRFAMVHDVIHERFPRHGPDYYRARNRAAKDAMSKLDDRVKGEADDHFRLLDDLGVGLEFLGQHQQAVDLMRDKLKRQERLGYKGKELYSTYANLGTFLILWQLSEGVGDVAQAKKRIQESVKWIRKAIEVYPEAHFGREQWQLVLEEFLLAVLDDPQILLRFDMIGNRLDKAIPEGRLTCFDGERWLYRKQIRWRPAAWAAKLLKERTEHPSEDQLARDVELVADLRSSITPAGYEEGSGQVLVKTSTDPTPFDEPTLGIVGMWRMGAGANPHFALALGEIMLRVGQRHIAWTAYQRALQLEQHFWPDSAIRRKFVEHCEARAASIEKEMPSENWQSRHARHRTELQVGQQYQKDYQEYEAKRLAEGASVDDPHFYDAFDANRPPIATQVGDEDRLFEKETVRDTAPWSWFCASLLALAAALAQTIIGKRWAQSHPARLEDGRTPNTNSQSPA